VILSDSAQSQNRVICIIVFNGLKEGR
jgi:hypothetical protein